MDKQLYKVISAIPLFSDMLSGLSKQQVSESFKVERMQSQSNKTYKLTFDQASYIIKIPQSHTNQYVDRENERSNSTSTYYLGISPEVLWSNADGVSLIDYINESRCLSQRDLQDSAILIKLADMIQNLHNSKAPFKGDVHDPDIILNALNTYYKICRPDEKEKLEPIYLQGLSSIKSLREYDLPAVPSHVDLTLGNILIENTKQQRLWLIDWEYSAMASPFWDIATICNNAEFDDAKASMFLDIIYSNKPSFEPSKHLKLLIDYRYIVDAVSQCWLSANSNRPPPNRNDD